VVRTALLAVVGTAKPVFDVKFTTALFVVAS
jgi:hypothetical protein